MDALKNISEVLTKHKRKFITTLVGMGLVFILALKGIVPGETASADIKVIALGFILLEIAGRTKLLSNGKN
jgi:hypothetical protein